MLLIAHRGNINGPFKDRENDPEYILETIDAGYHVEVDIWNYKDQFYLGHDDPAYPVDLAELNFEKMIFHAKNIEAMHSLRQFDAHYFWHEEDKCSLTSWGFVWGFPWYDGIISPHSIIVWQGSDLPDNYLQCAGVCSDYVKLIGEKCLR